jgi:hypothetical protein
VHCARKCTLTTKLKLAPASARALGRATRTAGTTTRTITRTSTQRIRVLLSSTVRQAAKRRGVKRLRVGVTATARYSTGGGSRSVWRYVTITL